MSLSKTQHAYLFYFLVGIGLITVLFSEPFLRYPYDAFAHLIAIDELYHGKEVSSQIPAGRLVWHHFWANIFHLLDLNSGQFFLRAQLIHTTQIWISFLSIYYFSYVVLRNLYKEHSQSITLKYLSLWSVLIWLSIFGTFSIKYQMVWTLWYSINYQISLPLFWYITALSIVLILEKTSFLKKIFFIIQILFISKLILQIHAMEYMYYLMHLSLLFLLYIKVIYSSLKKYYYFVIIFVIILILLLTSTTILRDESTLSIYLNTNNFSFIDTINTLGNTAVSRYSRANFTINELMYVILFLTSFIIPWILWRWTQQNFMLNKRLILYVLISSLFILIPIFIPTAGFFALITKENVVHRMYFSASLFLLLPIFSFYLFYKYKYRLLYINIFIAFVLTSTYFYSYHNKPHLFYKNIQSIIQSFKGTYHFHFSQADINIIADTATRFETLNPTNKEIMYFARQDIAFVLRYILHKRKVYWRGRKKFVDYKEAYRKHLIYDKYHKVVIPSIPVLPLLHPYQ